MAITYHAGRRIQGLERTGNTVDFTEDFSEATPTTWTEDSYGGSYDAHLEPYKGSVNRLWFDMDYSTTEKTSGTLDLANASLLGSNVSDTKWVMRFKINFDNLSSTGTIWVGLSDNAGASDVAQRFVGCRIKASSGFSCGADNSASTAVALNQGNATNGGSTSVSTSTDYYVTVERKSATLNTSTIRTGSHTGTVLGTGDDTSISSLQDDLRYWKVMNHLASGGGNIRGYIYDLEIYDGITSVVAAAGDVKPTDVQVGSRFEETDTRKMYHYVNWGDNWYLEGSIIPSEFASRGIFGGGSVDGSGASNIIDYIDISTLSNATDFGDLTVAGSTFDACGNDTRGLFCGGTGRTSVIDYVTIATIGNATDFGDLTVSRDQNAACASATRGLIGGGNAITNVIDYVTIATVGNATDFGDLTVGRRGIRGCASATRGVFGGGYSGAYSNVIDYVTIATTGNATDFGNLTVARYNCGALANDTRGLFVAGSDGSNHLSMDYITIATTGNASDFGDLSHSGGSRAGTASSTRGVIANTDSLGQIEYVTIATPSNSTDFGDLSVDRNELAATSGYQA